MSQQPPEPPAPPAPLPGLDITTDNPLGMPMLDVESVDVGGDGEQLGKPSKSTDELLDEDDTVGTMSDAAQTGAEFMEKAEAAYEAENCVVCRQIMDQLQEEDMETMVQGMAELAEIRGSVDSDMTEEEITGAIKDAIEDTEIISEMLVA